MLIEVSEGLSGRERDRKSSLGDFHLGCGSYGEAKKIELQPVFDKFKGKICQRQKMSKVNIIEFLHQYLPPFIKRWMRALLSKNEKFITKISPSFREIIRKTPFDEMDSRFIRNLLKYIDKNIPILLQVREVRQILARERLNLFLEKEKKIQTLKTETKNSAHNTIRYNVDSLLESVELDRPSILINPILSIQKVYKNISNLKVLSIGPRSEIEIFYLFSNGFKLDNIKAIDLLSYSPYVEVGDMHQMPFSDNSFDVILLGWVLSYSKDWTTVALEIIRSAKHGAIIAISADYSDASTVSPKFNGEATHVQNCDQILDLFSKNLGDVYFRHNSKYPETNMNMVIFELIKKNSESVN